MKKRRTTLSKLFLVLLLPFTVVCLSSCGTSTSKTTSTISTDDESSETASTQATDDTTQKMQVTVSFNAMYEFAKAVGQDKVEIKTIIPDGTEPHDFEPTASDIVSLSDADIFIYNGLGMESWADDAINASENSDLISIVASDGAEAIKNTDEDEVEEHGEYDPHLWLSLQGAMLEVQNIATGFENADPANADYYAENAADYIAELQEIYDTYSEKFASVDNKTFVTGHAAFHYFCRDFGLTQESVEDVYADGEPSTKQLAELIDFCTQNNVTVVFAEELASTKVTETLATETNATVETIYTVEGSEDGLSYLDRIQSNCEKIYQALSGQTTTS